ncbi:MAG TPA: RtcB family protein [Candidatus Brocadiia bacterium]|nr:RtcB family protein [Candidatus Brocadiia bacterium]
MSATPELVRVEDYLWEIPQSGGMRVPARLYAREDMLDCVRRDNSLEQVANVAWLPGIVKYSFAMPDIHQGYGFTIGGVAATDPAGDGVISPGGIGYDINCGVRMLSTDLPLSDVRARRKELLDALFRDIPCGVGSCKAIEKLSRKELARVCREGAAWAVGRDFGTAEDLDCTEENGCMAGAEPEAVGERAFERGAGQMGTLGSGNHFLEIDVVEEIFDPTVAEAFGVRKDGVIIQIHCGSRGFGHQICDDFVKNIMRKAVRKYGIQVPDPELCCAPVNSEEGRQYFAAMAGAANYAWANRQTIMHLTCRALSSVFGGSRESLGIRLIYDVCHNIAKFENHDVDGRVKRLCVHRKGATRAFPAGRPEVPARYRGVGQPVLIPGNMGTASYLLVGMPQAMKETFGSSCHGAGRVMSRHAAINQTRGRRIDREMEKLGILVRAEGRQTLAEEMPSAYKDVDTVVDVVDRAGISRKVARLRPIAVMKG